MRIVVKVGTHAIAAKSGRPDYPALRRLVVQLSALRKAGHDVFFVSSGAVAAGVEALGLKSRPTDVNDVQMCAAVGQARFISEYEKLFEASGVKIGQVLLTHDDFENRRRSQNVRRSLDHLVRAGIVPIINENDVVADEELKGRTFGDNDWLSFLIAKLVKADMLVLLTTVDGLLDAQGRRIPVVDRPRNAARLVRAGEKGSLSKGGMDSKLKAVKAAVAVGIDTYIANGRKSVLSPILSGRSVGTFFPGSALEARFFGLWQKRAIGQPSHFGRTGSQRVCPNDTRWEFHVFQYLTGSISRSFISVSTGFFVLTSSSQLQMRWTCTSTQIAGRSKPTATVRFAVLRPTPGSSQSSSTVCGSTPPNLSRSTPGSAFRWRALSRKKPTG